MPSGIYPGNQNWSIERRNKLSLAMMGKHNSPITEFKMGQNEWNKHPLFKNGKWSFREYFFRHKKERKCFYCGYNKKLRELFVHHIDHNRENNNLNNLMLVCRKCHCTVSHPRKFYGNKYIKI